MLQLAGVIMIVFGLGVKAPTFAIMLPEPVVGSIYIATYGNKMFSIIP